MAYLNSNQPYGRVDNGIGTGLMGGAIIGAAATAGAQFGGAMAVSKMRDYKATLRDRAAFTGSDLDRNRYENLTKATHKVNGYRKAAFGSGWRKAVSYGVGALAGAAIGGAIDANN
jgi:hypothetical protein